MMALPVLIERFKERLNVDLRSYEDYEASKRLSRTPLFSKPTIQPIITSAEYQILKRLQEQISSIDNVEQFRIILFMHYLYSEVTFYGQTFKDMETPHPYIDKFLKNNIMGLLELTTDERERLLHYFKVKNKSSFLPISDADLTNKSKQEMREQLFYTTEKLNGAFPADLVNDPKGYYSNNKSRKVFPETYSR